MKKSIRPYHIMWALCAVAVVGVFFIPGLRPDQVSSSPRAITSQSVAGTPIGGAFTLVNHNGETVNEKSWPDRYLLLYFGFAHCPDVCPLGLNRISEALNTLPENQLRAVQPILITVDPARDTAEELKKYVVLFHPKMVGLTGTQAQIDHMKKIYRVFAEKQGNDKDYMVNHSAFTYLIAPNGSLETVFSHETTTDEMSAQLKQRLPSIAADAP